MQESQDIGNIVTQNWFVFSLIAGGAIYGLYDTCRTLTRNIEITPKQRELLRKGYIIEFNLINEDTSPGNKQDDNYQ